MPILGNTSSAGKKPSTPTIGTATAGDASATVAYTASTYIGKGTITYTALSNPGSFTGTGASPITVSGLTNGTAYTFTVSGTTNYGVSSDASAASNSITPASAVSFESIATATGTGSSTVITFSSIPSTFKHLQIRAIGRTSTSYREGAVGIIRFNSDTGSNYAQHRLYGSSSSAGANGNASRTSMAIIQTDGALTGSNILAPNIIDIHDYSSSSKNKTVRSFNGSDANDADGTINLYSGLWLNTSAVTTITITSLTGNWTTQSTFALYGIKG